MVAATIGAALAAPMLVAAGPATPAAAAAPVVGLYGSSDATYDGVYRGSLAILGIRAAGRTPRAEAVHWLLSQQCADGSFTSYKPTQQCAPFDPETYTGGPDSNATAMAAEALFAVGTPTAKSAAAKAARYLRTVQLADGSWEYNPGSSGAGDPNSTGLVLLALNAAGLVPNHDPAAYFAGLQVGRDAFGSHEPAAERGAISTPWAPGSPNLLATVQAIPGLRAMDFAKLPGASAAWAATGAEYSELPPATAAGVSSWATSYVARAVADAGADAFAAADRTNAAWAVLSLAADRTGKETAVALEAALEKLPSTTSPAANGQLALAAIAVGDKVSALAYARRAEASLARDAAAPKGAWKLSRSAIRVGAPVRVDGAALADGFWPTSRLTINVAWGDGKTTAAIGRSTSAISHRYARPGRHAIRVTVTDPSGNSRTTRAGIVTVARR